MINEDFEQLLKDYGRQIGELFSEIFQTNDQLQIMKKDQKKDMDTLFLHIQQISKDFDSKFDKSFALNIEVFEKKVLALERNYEVQIGNITSMMSLMRKENEVILAKQSTPEGKPEPMEERKEKFEKNESYDEVLNEIMSKSVESIGQISDLWRKFEEISKELKLSKDHIEGLNQTIKVDFEGNLNVLKQEISHLKANSQIEVIQSKLLSDSSFKSSLQNEISPNLLDSLKIDLLAELRKDEGLREGLKAELLKDLKPEILQDLLGQLPKKIENSLMNELPEKLTGEIINNQKFRENMEKNQCANLARCQEIILEEMGKFKKKIDLEIDDYKKIQWENSENNRKNRENLEEFNKEIKSLESKIGFSQETIERKLNEKSQENSEKIIYLEKKNRENNELINKISEGFAEKLLSNKKDVIEKFDSQIQESTNKTNNEFITSMAKNSKDLTEKIEAFRNENLEKIAILEKKHQESLNKILNEINAKIQDSNKENSEKIGVFDNSMKENLKSSKIFSENLKKEVNLQITASKQAQEVLLGKIKDIQLGVENLNKEFQSTVSEQKKSNEIVDNNLKKLDGKINEFEKGFNAKIEENRIKFEENEKKIHENRKNIEENNRNFEETLRKMNENEENFNKKMQKSMENKFEGLENSLSLKIVENSQNFTQDLKAMTETLEEQLKINLTSLDDINSRFSSTLKDLQSRIEDNKASLKVELLQLNEQLATEVQSLEIRIHQELEQQAAVDLTRLQSSEKALLLRLEENFQDFKTLERKMSGIEEQFKEKVENVDNSLKKEVKKVDEMQRECSNRVELMNQDFTIKLNKTLDGCLKKITLVEENFKENVEGLATRVRKLGDFDKISGNIETLFNKCEKYEINFKNLMVNLTNFKNELVKMEAEAKSHTISQQDKYSESVKSIWETMNIINKRLLKIEGL